MPILRPNQLPAATTPLGATDKIVVDQGASGVNGADPQDVVDAVAPVVSQADAEAGVDNVDRMTALRTKQSIASEVGVTIASQAQGALAATAVQPSRQVIAGAGLTGGGDLSADRTFNVGAGTGITVNADDIALSATTISRLIPAAGTTSQVLQKVSNTDYDVAWATVAAATAVSYAPQSLTSGEQLQARTNISAADATTAVTLTGSQTLTNKTLTAPVVNTPQGEFLRGHINGLTLSNNATDATNDIDIATGSAGSDGTTPVLMALASSLTKRLDAAWVVGTGNGGLDTGSIANGTYHVWLIQRSDTGVVDALFSTSATSPTMPTNYDRKRRIGSIIRVSGAIKAFTQFGNTFKWTNFAVDRASTSAVGSSLLALTVPSGVVVEPLLSSEIYSAGAANVSNNIGDAAAGTANVEYQQIVSSSGGELDVCTLRGFFTNTSAQLYFACAIVSGTLAANALNTLGWVDMRGKI